MGPIMQSRQELKCLETFQVAGSSFAVEPSQPVSDPLVSGVGEAAPGPLLTPSLTAEDPLVAEGTQHSSSWLSSKLILTPKKLPRNIQDNAKNILVL